MTPEDDPPYVDEHRIRIEAPRPRVWSALCRYVDATLAVAADSSLARLLRTEPRAGFQVAGAVANSRLDLTGRHRFSRYRLVFDLTDSEDAQTLLSARTYAAFPGLHGRVYRALVIGTRGHVVMTNHILRSIRRSTLG